MPTGSFPVFLFSCFPISSFPLFCFPVREKRMNELEEAGSLSVWYLFPFCLDRRVDL